MSSVVDDKIDSVSGISSLQSSEGTAGYETADDAEKDDVKVKPSVRFDENVEIKEAPYVEIEEDVEPKEVVREDDRDDELSFDDGGHDDEAANSDNSLNAHQEGQSDDDGSSSGDPEVPHEREEGDGQEEGEKSDKKLDHDEDRRDPQYIPKRGVFYEHDDRTLDDEAAPKKEPERPPRKNKVEGVERWGHDKYNEDEQCPKSTQELIDTYGYDIRKEDGAPKARRRRRYGKGPNKYDRNWEDEQAYSKTPTRGGYKGNRPRKSYVENEEDFPSLETSIKGRNSAGSPDRRRQLKDSIKPMQFNPDEQMSPDEVKTRSSTEPAAPPRQVGLRGRGGARRGSGRLPPASDQIGNDRRPNQAPNPDQIRPFTANKSNKSAVKGNSAHDDIAELVQHFTHAVINVDNKNIAPIRSNAEEASGKGGSSGSKHQPEGTGQDKHKIASDPHSVRSKRYSTQRHSRPQQAPSTGNQQQLQPQQMQQQPIPQQQQQQQQQPPANYMSQAPPPPQQGYYPPPPQHGMCPPPPPPEATTHITAPPPAQYPQPPPAAGLPLMTFLPQVAPPPANTFQPPPNIFVPSAPYIAPPPIVQPGPAELYQGGVTYYNTQSQQVTRAVPSRRVKLAIPIVSPDSHPIQ
ncbi:Btz [Nesidiocoris tenuis]|uniref:Protein CASC3 n=1 Tax=Nesidiocoris tenuis TaxID=355587 RepID=A0ABN7BDZ2_9HEMI|nr:Btz [Nesidiocoris tenuis]